MLCIMFLSSFRIQRHSNLLWHSSTEPRLMTMWNLHALMRRLGIGDNFSDIDGLSSERQAIETDFSATVFSGDPQQWIRYLGMRRAERYTETRVPILWNQADRTLSFQAEEPGARELASRLNLG